MSIIKFPANYLNSTRKEVLEEILLGINTHGIYHTRNDRESNPTYQNAEVEKVVSKNNSHIILGKDRNEDFESGFGALGAPSSNAIDLVVGLQSSYLANGQKISSKKKVGKNFFTDAARVYISQRCDLHQYFGFGKKDGKNYKDIKNDGASGIGIKADNVFVIGRRNVKIKAGGVQLNVGREKDAHGRRIPESRIELLGGSKETEPVVLGYKAAALFKRILEDLDFLKGEIVNLHYKNVKLNIRLALHIHGDPISGVTLPSPDMIASSMIDIPEELDDMVKGIVNKYIDKINELNAIEIPNRTSYILSKNVFTT